MTRKLLFSGHRFVSSPLDDGLLIARLADDRLFVFNSAARFIWERLADGVAESEIPALITAQFGVAIAQAEDDSNNTIQRWREHGLIRHPGPSHRYEIAGFEFDLRCNDVEIADALTSMLMHLTSDAIDPPALEIDLHCHAETFVLRFNGVKRGGADTSDDFIAKLLSEIFRYVSEKTEWVISLHAAAVAAADRCIVMPGASGAGKSSLTAALLAFGNLQLVADDLVLLGGSELAVTPIPLPLVLKRGSWDALSPILPDLTSCAIRRRLDQDCRYWIPSRERIARKPVRVTAFIFPHYVEGAATTLTPVPPLEAFGLITTAPAAIRPPITGLTLGALADFAHDVPAYTLTYGALIDARDIVRGLLLT